jgi:hypothetical protein
MQLPNPGTRARNETNPGLLGTRRATSAAIDAFAGNMGVVREESGSTDTDCARGSPDGGLELRCGGYAQVPAPRLCGTAGD